MTPFTGTMRITSKRGARTLNGVTKPHNGKDAVPTAYAGQAAEESRWRTRALTAGTVAGIGYDAARGRYVDVRFAGGSWWRFQHMEAISVKVGDAVQAGQCIGTAGNTGHSTGRHLHYEVWMDGGYVDPDILDGLPNKAGVYSQNDIVYGEDEMKFKIFPPMEKTVSSQMVDEGVMAVMGADGVLRAYDFTGDARLARAYTAATKSAVFEGIKQEMQAGEAVVSADGGE